jgi:hypothetical protein
MVWNAQAHTYIKWVSAWVFHFMQKEKYAKPRKVTGSVSAHRRA